MNTSPRHGKHALLLLALLSLASPACQPMADMENDGATTAAADDTTAAAASDGTAPKAATKAAADGGLPTSGVAGGRDTVRETLVVVNPLTVGPIRDVVVVSAKVEARHSAQVFPKLSGLPVTSVAVWKLTPAASASSISVICCASPSQNNWPWSRW